MACKTKKLSIRVGKFGAAAYKRLAAPRIGEEKRWIVREFEEFVDGQK